LVELAKFNRQKFVNILITRDLKARLEELRPVVEKHLRNCTWKVTMTEIINFLYEQFKKPEILKVPTLVVSPNLVQKGPNVVVKREVIGAW